MPHTPFLQHCLRLAENGRGSVSPNPLVGCVIVQDGQVLTEGWHTQFGEAHAEVIALRKAGDLARGATLYVNLEPCCTQGKQPPCTDAIVRAGIAQVVFGARDQSNSGADVVRKVGIEVIGPIMEAECRRQNKGFFSLLENGRPYVTIKKAMRADGSIDGKITNEEQDHWSHAHLRATHDAILVGAGTVVADDPKLTIRPSPLSPIPSSSSPASNTSREDTSMGEGGWEGEGFFQPRRIILDPHSQIPTSAKILTDEHADRTIVIHEKLSIPALLDRLKNEGIASVLVEGGPKVWNSFEESGCVDEVVILTGKQ